MLLEANLPSSQLRALMPVDQPESLSSHPPLFSVLQRNTQHMFPLSKHSIKDEVHSKEYIKSLTLPSIIKQLTSPYVYGWLHIRPASFMICNTFTICWNIKTPLLAQSVFPLLCLLLVHHGMI